MRLLPRLGVGEGPEGDEGSFPLLECQAVRLM